MANNYLKHQEILELEKKIKECSPTNKSACAERDELLALSKERDRKLDDCSGVENSYCNGLRKDVRYAYADIIRKADQKFGVLGAPGFYYKEQMRNTELMADSAISKLELSKGGIHGLANGIYEGGVETLKMGITFGKVLFGDEEAERRADKAFSDIWSVLKNPGIWAPALETALSDRHNKLANAYEDGDAFLIGSIRGGDLSNIVGSIGKVGKVGGAAEDAILLSKNAEKVALGIEKSGIAALGELESVTYSGSGRISSGKISKNSYSLIDLNVVEDAIIKDVINNKDKLGTATEKLVEMVGERQGLKSLAGGKYGSNNGFDHVFQNTDGSVTILLDSKQMTEAGAKLSPAAAGKTVQMSDEWVEKVIDNLVPTSPAAIAIEKALRNGTLVKGVAAIDKSSGKLIILRVQ